MTDQQSPRLPFFSRFLRRRKYGVLDPDHNIPPPTPSTGQAETLPATSAPAPALVPSRSIRVRPKSRLRVPGIFSRRPNSQTARRTPTPTPSGLGKSGTASPAPEPARAAVETFLSGPVPESEEETYRRECMNVLRKLSASGRVPGYVY